MIDLKQLKEQLQGYSHKGSILVIDGDSISFLIGWHHRDHDDAGVVEKALRSWLKDFFLLSNASACVGFLDNSTSTQMNYREETYKFKKYKGKRGEKPDWIRKWQPVINNILKQDYGFEEVPYWAEADDFVALISNHLTSIEVQHLICSPDKDLKQIPGTHYNYKKPPEEALEVVTPKQALYNWCMQMLMGDETDNIAGVPKIGEKKAQELLRSNDEEMWVNSVKMKYQEYFGEYYGPLIYNETKAIVTMCVPDSPIFKWALNHNFYPGSFLSLIKPIEQ